MLLDKSPPLLRNRKPTRVYFLFDLARTSEDRVLLSPTHHCHIPKFAQMNNKKVPPPNNGPPPPNNAKGPPPPNKGLPPPNIVQTPVNKGAAPPNIAPQPVNRAVPTPVNQNAAQGQGNANPVPNPVLNPVTQGGGVARGAIRGAPPNGNVANNNNNANANANANPAGQGIGGQNNAGQVLAPDAGKTPLVPREFNGWQWVKVTSGIMPNPNALKPTTEPFTLATTIGNEDLYKSKSPGLPCWRFIIPGPKAQFAMSFESLRNNQVATSVTPESGVTSTARQPQFTCSFGRQTYHTFGWAAGTVPCVEVDELNTPLISIWAKFLGPAPPIMCWQLWHLRRPGDPQPIGDQDPATNGSNTAKQNAAQMAARYEQERRDVLESERQTGARLNERAQEVIRERAGFDPYDNNQPPVVAPVDAHPNVGPNGVVIPPVTAPNGGTAVRDTSRDYYGPVNGGNGGGGFDLFNQ